MRARWPWIILFVLLASSAVIVYVYRTAIPPVAYYVLQSLLCVGIALLMILYRGIFKPMRAVVTGLDLLHEQDFSSSLAYVGQKDADKIVDLFNGMIASLKEERLHVREQSHLMDLLIEKSPMGVIILNGMDIITSANPAALLYLSASGGIIGMKPASVGGALAEVLARLKDGECVTKTLSDSMIYRCSRLAFMDKGYRHPFFIIEPMTREVREAQKESYGKVIRVLSHEVNNSMTSVESILSTIACVNDNPDMAELIDVCMQRCHSLSSFITSYASVVKIPQAQPRKVSIAEFVGSIRILLESMCGAHHCAFVYVCKADFLVNIDTVLMEQALINIVKNAVESITSRERAPHSDAPSGTVRIVVDGASRTLVVEDDGPGIPDEAIPHLFTPFFSTKPNGQGIGLIFIAEVLTRNYCTFSLRTCPDGKTRFSISI